MRRLPELTLLLLALIWGGTFLATRTILREVGPFTLLTLRFALGAGTLGLIARRLPTREEARVGIGIGLVVFGCYAGQTVALGHIDSSLSAFLTAAGVPVVAILQATLLRRVPAGRVWVAAVVAAVGVALLGLREGGVARFGPYELLTLASAGLGALQVVLIGRWAERFDPVRFTGVQLATVAALALPWGAIEPHPLPGLGTAGLIVLMGVVATGLVLALMTWAQRTVEPARAVLIYALEPVFAGALGLAVGERIGPYAGLGAALVVGAAIVGDWPVRARSGRTSVKMSSAPVQNLER